MSAWKLRTSEGPHRVAAVGIAAGCSAERRIEGANQDLVRQRDSSQREIGDLRTQLAQRDATEADMKARLKRLQAEKDYWKGQAKAYAGANDKARLAPGEHVRKDHARPGRQVRRRISAGRRHKARHRISCSTPARPTSSRRPRKARRGRAGFPVVTRPGNCS